MLYTWVGYIYCLLNWFSSGVGGDGTEMCDVGFVGASSSFVFWGGEGLIFFLISPKLLTCTILWGFPRYRFPGSPLAPMSPQEATAAAMATSMSSPPPISSVGMQRSPRLSSGAGLPPKSSPSPTHFYPGQMPTGAAEAAPPLRFPESVAFPGLGMNGGGGGPAGYGGGSGAAPSTSYSVSGASAVGDFVSVF